MTRLPVSAWSDPEIVRTAMDNGADRYIVKGNLDFRALEQIVQQYLGQLNDRHVRKSDPPPTCVS